LMSYMKLIPEGIRLPLSPPSGSTKEQLKKLVEKINFFEGE